jgi:DNA-binding transcriptional LysR family regulator
MVEVREARYFIAVAEELNFGRAAERLQMSQPPLSAAIKSLEKRLGVVLLHRTTREVRLTPPGTVFLTACRIVVAAAHNADSAARQAADGQAGELRIGAVTTAFTDPLPYALRAFTASHPHVDVRMREVDTHVAVGMLQRRELDIALIRQLAPPPDCERVALKEESFVLVVPADWDLPSALEENLKASAELPWIWLPRSISPDYHDQVATCCRLAGFTPHVQHLASSITSQLAMVACGLGVALVPESATHHVDRTGMTRTIPVRDSASIDLAAVWRRGHSPLVGDFLTSLDTDRHRGESDD